MTLNPSRYACPDHHSDLTALVEEALELQGPPVAYRPGPRRFQVIVTWADGTSWLPGLVKVLNRRPT
ncbi:MAG TPA: hypothetical protein VGF54_13065 [Streptosporangiaceae bacterium]|jgi:hypothetical protein